MPSLTDVARHAGVSVSTASVVLNPGRNGKHVSDEVKARVRAAAMELGYVANYHARSMKLGRAMNIGVPLDTGGWFHHLHGRLAHPYFAHLVGGIEVTCARAGYSTLMLATEKEDLAPLRAIRGIKQRRLDGAVVPGTIGRLAYVHEMTIWHPEPLVLVEYGRATELPNVLWDEDEAVRLAVSHLAELGHRRLLWLGPRDAPDTGFHLRETLFLMAIVRQQLAAELCEFDRPTAGTHADWPRHPEELAADAAEGALAAYLADGRRGFTAVVCYNDYIAAGAYRALAAAGRRVPRDVSVLGFDDFLAPWMSPKLTSLDRRLLDVGQKATEIVLAMIERPAEAESRFRGHREVVAPRLVVRDSTAPPPAA